MEKFTEGEWVVREVCTGFAIYYNKEEEQVVDFVYEQDDAYLMAAAKELYWARKLIVNSVTWYRSALEIDVHTSKHDGEELLDIANAVLSKARGEQ